jgi:hypothetical protein
MSKKKAWKGASSMFVDFLEKGAFAQAEFDFLVNNEMYSSVENKYSGYKTISWTTQRNDFINFYEGTYPRWSYDNCDKKGYHATEFKKFADKLGTIDAMALGV